MKSFDVIWRYSAKCPKSNQELFLTCWLIFWRSLIVIELLATHVPFYYIFYWPAVGQLIPRSTRWLIFKLPLLLNHSSVSDTLLLVRKLWCCNDVIMIILDQSQSNKLVYNCAKWLPPSPSKSTISTGWVFFTPYQSVDHTTNPPSRTGLNEIKQIIYSLYQAKKITKKVFNNIMSLIKL